MSRRDPVSASSAGVASELAPTGTLRVAVWTVSYFAVPDPATGRLVGVIPDLAEELARRLGVPTQLFAFDNPGAILAAFRNQEVDVTFLGITADRAEAMEFGPTVIDIQTTCLVPAGSPISGIDEIDQPGVRILVPERSAQGAYLKTTLRRATMIPVPAGLPAEAIAQLAAGEADAFSHVVPMLVTAQAALPGSRILPGSYFNVPVAIAAAKGKPQAAAFCRSFIEEAKASGFVREAIRHSGAPGLVVAP
jgi:polar amino acid transport system substrate-binding protein